MTGIFNPHTHNPKNKAQFPVLWLILIIVIGGFIRLVHVINLDFPLNDGGFFYQAIIDLQRANFFLPLTTSYNSRGIPFAYPPLGLYIGAGLADVFGLSVLNIVRLLPATTSILTIPAFFLLSRRIFNSSTQVIYATFAFAFLPTSFDWLIVGGGLTRSFGYLFAILTLWQVHNLFTSRGRLSIILTILFASLTILSHPGTAWFAVYSTFILLAFHYDKGEGKWWIKSILVSLGVILLTSPWWLTVVDRHGFEVLIAPFQTESLTLTSFLTPFTFLFTNEPLLDVLAFWGLLGVLISLVQRSFFLPVWLFTVFLFESRLGATYSVVPTALLVGFGIDQVIRRTLVTKLAVRSRGFPRIVPGIALVYFGFYAIINAYLGIDYKTVTQEQLAAMAWIKSNTPEDSRFLVLTGTPEYGIDQVSEWFPVFSQRTSLTTPQAHEWLPDQEFNRRDQIHAELQACATQDLECIETWAARNDVQFTHIYIPDSVVDSFSLNPQAGYQILYDGTGGIVLTQNKHLP
jgi:hypothetical protein